jgi:hypothetical protein
MKTLVPAFPASPRQLALLIMGVEACEGLSQTDLVGRTGIDRSHLGQCYPSRDRLAVE